MTRAELAFSALDRNKKGYITTKDLGKLTKKLSKEEVQSLMSKLDTDGDGQLSFEEFKVLFENADKRKQSSGSKKAPAPESLIKRTTSERVVSVELLKFLEFSMSCTCDNISFKRVSAINDIRRIVKFILFSHSNDFIQIYPSVWQ